MRLLRLDPAPGFATFGVLTPAGEGVAPLLARRDARRAGPAHATTPQPRLAIQVPVDLPALCGEPPLRFRRMDRYGRLGYAAAHRALAGLPPALRPVARPAAAADATVAADPAARADPDWGIMIGSSHACGRSIADHQRDLRERPVAALSPSLFVRTVANSVNGDISIGWNLGGPVETFVSGWTAGAEALLAAGAALQEGRARRILAGAAEDPGGARRRGESTVSGPGGEPIPVEAAAMAVLGLGNEGVGEGALRLRACLRGHDPAGRFSLAAALDACGPIRCGTVIVANTLPLDLLSRIEEQAGERPVVHLPLLSGELGAVGAPVAAALADAITRIDGGGPGAGRLNSATAGVLVIARDPAGSTAVLALSR